MSATPPGGPGTVPHYQLGDLGLIPRPAQHIPSHIERVKELSTNQRLGSLKKVLTKSVAVQTVSTPKVRYYHFGFWDMKYLYKLNNSHIPQT